MLLSGVPDGFADDQLGLQGQVAGGILIAQLVNDVLSCIGAQVENRLTNGGQRWRAELGE